MQKQAFAFFLNKYSTVVILQIKLVLAQWLVFVQV